MHAPGPEDATRFRRRLTATSDYPLTVETNRKRVCDVIGHPQSWTDDLGQSVGPPDFQGATISEVIAVGSEVAICTTGGACGSTFSVFNIDDADLRNRVVQALRPGLTVYEAAAAEI